MNITKQLIDKLPKNINRKVIVNIGKKPQKEQIEMIEKIMSRVKSEKT